MHVCVFVLGYEKTISNFSSTILTFCSDLMNHELAKTVGQLTDNTAAYIFTHVVNTVRPGLKVMEITKCGIFIFR